MSCIICLGALIDKSLVFKMDEGTVMRFQMLEYIREFCMDKLKATGKYEAAKEKQADFYHHCLQRIKLQQNKVDQNDILQVPRKRAQQPAPGNGFSAGEKRT